MSSLDETWKFWAQFVFVDAMVYIGLFLAICSGNWHLRKAVQNKWPHCSLHLIIPHIKN